MNRIRRQLISGYFMIILSLCIYIMGCTSSPSGVGTGDDNDDQNEPSWSLIATENDINSLWAYADDDAYAGCSNGIILHYDGSGWRPMDESYHLNTFEHINGIFGFAPDDIYACEDGGVLHYNGSEWTMMPGSPQFAKWCMWGTGPTNLFVAGNDGIISRYDGSSWSDFNMESPYTIWDIWGSSADDIFAVGNRAKIYHYNGVSWETMAISAGTSNFGGVWGSSATNVYACGGGKLYHYNGSAWSLEEIGATVNDVWGHATDDIYVMTSTGVMHFDGVSWSSVAGIGNISGKIAGIEGGTGYFTYLYDVGYFDGVEWGYHIKNTPYKIQTITGSGDGGLFCGTYYGQNLLFQNNVWSAALSTSDEASPSYSWCNSPTDFFIASGSRYVVRNSGGSTDGNFHPSIYAEGIWSPGGNVAFCPAWSGTIYRLDGAVLSAIDTPTSQRLMGLWGTSENDIMAVGEAGTILHFDGVEWSLMTSGTSAKLYDVWCAAENDAYAVGTDGTLLHYNGTAWSAEDGPAGLSSGNWTEIQGDGNGDLWIMNISDYVFHFDGSSWEEENLSGVMGLRQMWCNGIDDVYVINGVGDLYRYH